MSLSVDLLRHGEIENAHQIHGWDDVALTAAGRDALWHSVGEQWPWTHIVSSTLGRCSDFAHTLAEKSGVPFRAEARFREFNFGQWQGQTAQALLEQDNKTVSAFYADPHAVTPPGGESMRDFQYRVYQAWDHLRQQPGKCLLVTHGGVIRLLLMRVLAVPAKHWFRLNVPYAGMTRINVNHQGRETVAYHARQSPISG